MRKNFHKNTNYWRPAIYNVVMYIIIQRTASDYLGGQNNWGNLINIFLQSFDFSQQFQPWPLNKSHLNCSLVDELIKTKLAISPDFLLMDYMDG